jgi:hypothetical protein
MFIVLDWMTHNAIKSYFITDRLTVTVEYGKRTCPMNTSQDSQQKSALDVIIRII